MSTLKTQSIDLPSGTAITTSSTATAGNTAFNYVGMTAITLTASTLQKAHGLSSVLVHTPTTGSNNAQMTLSMATIAPNTFSWRVYAYFTGLPSGATAFVQSLTSSTTYSLNNLLVGSTGKIGFDYGPSSSPTTVYVSGVTLPLNTWLRFEGTAVLSSTTTGSVSLSVFNLDSTTPLGSVTTTGIVTQDSGNSGLKTLQFGKNTSAPIITDYYLDDFGVVDSGTAIGPFVAASPSVIASAAVSGTALTLSETSITYDSVAPTVLWSQTAGTALTLSSTSASSPTATLVSADTYTFTVTVTDDLGKTATDQVTLTYAGASTAPAVTGTVTGTNNWVEAVVGTPVAGGTMSYSISPSTGVQQVAPGVFTAPIPAVSTAYTVTATESGNANVTTFTFTVAGAPTASGTTTIRILLASDDQSLGGTFS